MKLSPSRTPSYNVALPVALCVSLLSPAFAAPAPLFLEAAQALVSGLPNMPVPPSSTTSSSQALSTNAVRINGTLVGNGGYLAAKTPSQIAAGDTAGFMLYNCVNQRQIALTWDDGAQTNHAAIRQILDKYNAKGTFFINGRNFACSYNNAEALQQSHQNGHQFGSHTWSHTDITKLTPAQLNGQLFLVETLLQKVIGAKPAMFRPPYGFVNNGALSVIAARNYSAVAMWNGIAGAGTGTSVQQSLSWIAGNAASFPQSHVILMHEQDNEALAQIYEPAIQQLQRAGYQLVTMSDCLNLPAYQSVGPMGVRDSTWTCDGTPAPGAFQ